MKTKNEKLSEEFKLFMLAGQVAQPKHLSFLIQEEVRRDLNPGISSVLMKVLTIHALVSLISLSLCSQFGFQVFPLFDLMNLFMKFAGSTSCMLFCGAIYLGLSSLALGLFLRPQDVEMIRRHRFLQLTFLSGVSLGIFLCLGTSVLFIPAVVWLAGAVIGGVTTLELGWFVRSQYRKQVTYGV